MPSMKVRGGRGIDVPLFLLSFLELRQTICRQMVRLMLINELERLWSEVAVAYLKLLS
jgi:hypothetical protein